MLKKQAKIGQIVIKSTNYLDQKQLKIQKIKPMNTKTRHNR